MSPSKRPLSILVVDDIVDVRELIACLLTAEGHRVLTAPDAREGIRVVSSQPVDLVVTDKEMPGGDGFELLGHVKAAPEPRPPVFLMTGAARHVVELAYAMGAEVVFAKPFPPGDILDAVDRYTRPLEDRLSLPSVDSARRLAAPLKIVLEKPASSPCIVGRGGIFVAASSGDLPATGSRVAFSLEIEGPPGREPAAPRVVDGHGIVRWTRGQTHGLTSGFGLEFERLPKHVARLLSTWSTAGAVVPFIPRGG